MNKKHDISGSRRQNLKAKLCAKWMMENQPGVYSQIEIIAWEKYPSETSTDADEDMQILRKRLSGPIEGYPHTNRYTGA